MKKLFIILCLFSTLSCGENKQDLKTLNKSKNHFGTIEKGDAKSLAAQSFSKAYMQNDLASVSDLFTEDAICEFDEEHGGTWIGKETIKKIVLNQTALTVDDDMIEIYDIVKNQLGINDINSLESKLIDEGDMVFKTALLAKDIITSAQNGNDISLSIIQEGTRNVAEYILFLIDDLKISKNKVIIAGNGSIIKNEFYRKSLNDSLQFDINDIHWVFSNISCAYSAGIMAAKYKNINVSINDIVKNIN